MKVLFSLLFIARVLFPMSPQVYKNVVKIAATPEGYYVLSLQSGKKVYVPIMFTTIEEL